MSTDIMCPFFICSSTGLFEVVVILFTFPPSIEQLAWTQSIDVSRHRGHLHPGILSADTEDIVFLMQKKNYWQLAPTQYAA